MDILLALITAFVLLFLWGLALRIRRRPTTSYRAETPVVFTAPTARPPKPMHFDRDDLSTEPLGIQWDVLSSDAVRQYLPDRKLEAIKAYMHITGFGLKDSKDAVEYALLHPKKLKGSAGVLPATMSDAGIRDLLEAGRVEEAVDVYRTFTGVDTFTARNAVEELQRQSERGMVDDDEDIRQLVRTGRKIEAIKQYRQRYDVGLKEAKDAVDALADAL